MSNDWNKLSESVLAGGEIGRDDALRILHCPEDELLSLMQAAFTIRHKYWGRGVNLHVLQNAKSGMCRENCKFCSQAIGAYSGVDRYRMQSVDELVEGARSAAARKAVKYCVVTATRGPSPREMETICEAARQIKAEMDIKICTSLGLLSEAQARELAEAGVDRFNHNLETSQRYYPEVCDTHSFQDRLNTLRYARNAGMELCCGGIMGMGETDEDRVDLALTLREVGVDSIPVNFLDPRPGTPLGELQRMSPQQCLNCLAMFRFTNPTRDIRAAGGREVCLRHLQPLALYPANSIFTEGYLTTGGQGHHTDLEMLEDAGFQVAEIVADDH